MRLNISKNNAGDVDYDWELNGSQTGPYNRWWNGYGQGARAFSAMSSAWSGVVFAPNYSPDGGVVFNGGGHGAGQGQFVHPFSVSSGQWERVGALRS